MYTDTSVLRRTTIPAPHIIQRNLLLLYQNRYTLPALPPSYPAYLKFCVHWFVITVKKIYLGVERGAAIKRSTPQTLFLRAISHRPETYSMEGANQVGNTAHRVAARYFENAYVEVKAQYFSSK